MVQPSPTMDLVRAGADPEVWTSVSRAMRRVEAQDSIVFRTGDVGLGWRIAARTLGVAALLWATTGTGRWQRGLRPATAREPEPGMSDRTGRPWSRWPPLSSSW